MIGFRQLELLAALRRPLPFRDGRAILTGEKQTNISLPPAPIGRGSRL